MKVSFKGWYEISAVNKEEDAKAREFIQNAKKLRYSSQNTIKDDNRYFMHVNDNYVDVFESEAKKYGIADIKETNVKEILACIESKDSVFYSQADKLLADLYKAFKNGAKINIKPKGKINLVYVKEKDKPVKIFGLNTGMGNGKLLFEQHRRGKYTIQNFFDTTYGFRIGHFVFSKGRPITSEMYQQNHIIRNGHSQTEIIDYITNKLEMPFGVIK